MEDLLLSLSDREFQGIAELVYDRFGIHLSDQKRTLVVGRLTKHVRRLGLDSFGAYLDYLRKDGSGQELVEFINRITTNHSFFYREKDHFEFLKDTAIPALRPALERDAAYPLRIWSAGCATGEEPYTLAMVVQEALGNRSSGVDWGILGTDISRAALEIALHGTYPEARVKELPEAWRTAYMRSGEDDEWAVKPELRRSVLFKRLNLMDESYPFKGLFDAVFCRNVMIYFDVPVRRALVDRIYRYVKPGGYFFVGHSESLPRDTCPFSYVRPAIYRKAERP